LARDALTGVWLALTLPVKRLITDAVADALERERLTLATWTDRDEAAVDDYTREPD
jgi:hypothetical protein